MGDFHTRISGDNFLEGPSAFAGVSKAKKNTVRWEEYLVSRILLGYWL